MEHNPNSVQQEAAAVIELARLMAYTTVETVKMYATGHAYGLLHTWFMEGIPADGASPYGAVSKAFPLLNQVQVRQVCDRAFDQWLEISQ